MNVRLPGVDPIGVAVPCVAGAREALFLLRRWAIAYVPPEAAHAQFIDAQTGSALDAERWTDPRMPVAVLAVAVDPADAPPKLVGVENIQLRPLYC